MQNQLATVASSKVAAVSTFLVTHSVALAFGGGTLLGLGAYYYLNRRKKNKAEEAQVTEAVTA
jgi:LPXTG-motif cell wall-anchored protein